MSCVVGRGPGCEWLSPPHRSHVSRPLLPSSGLCVGRTSAVAPSAQSGITRDMRERVVSRQPSITLVGLGDGWRVRPVGRLCLYLVACARDGRGANHGAAGAAPERITDARDRLAWRPSGSHWPAAGAASISTTAPCPPATPHADPRPSAPGRSRQRRCQRISRRRWLASLVAIVPHGGDGAWRPGTRGQVAHLAVRLQKRSASGLRYDRCLLLVGALEPSGQPEVHQLNCRAASRSPRNGSLTFEMPIHVALDPLPGTKGLLGELGPPEAQGLEVVSGPWCPGERAQRGDQPIQLHE